MTTRLQQYQSRIKMVLDYIDTNLDGCLDLETLSNVAAFSKFHFHRQFMATIRVPLNRYVQLARMKRASYKLAFRQKETVTEIAMDSGYGAPDSFARAFRQNLGQGPSAFRKNPDWQRWMTTFEPFHFARNRCMQTRYQSSDVTIRCMPSTKVAIMRHQGSPSDVGATVQRFIAWRQSTGLIPPVSQTFNVFYSDPRTSPPGEFRLDLCAGTDRPIQSSDISIVAGDIPAGRCAVINVVGSSDNLEQAAIYLYSEWLPVSGEELRNFPLYCQRIKFFPDVPESEAVTDLFLPLM